MTGHDEEPSAAPADDQSVPAPIWPPRPSSSTAAPAAGDSEAPTAAWPAPASVATLAQVPSAEERSPAVEAVARPAPPDTSPSTAFAAPAARSDRLRRPAAMLAAAAVVAAVSGAAVWTLQDSPEPAAARPDAVADVRQVPDDGTGSAPSEPDELAPPPETTTAASAPTPSSPPVPEVSAAEQMAQLDELLTRTTDAHTDVNAAVAAIQRCTDAAASAASLREAAQTRRELALSIEALDVSAVAGADGLLASLHGAMTASAEADDAFAMWGDEVALLSCSTSPPSAWFDEGIAISRTARAHKQDFAAAWNPLARAHGLPERLPLDL